MSDEISPIIEVREALHNALGVLHRREPELMEQVHNTYDDYERGLDDLETIFGALRSVINFFEKVVSK